MKLLFVRMLLVFFLSTPLACAADKYVKTPDGFQIAYVFKKAKQARGSVLLVHGLGEDLDTWHSFAKSLRKAGWNTLAIDLRGHGLSTVLNDEEYSWSDLTEALLQGASRDVEAALSLLPAEGDVWVIGASFGANLVFNLASQNQTLDGAILLSPSMNYAGVITWDAAKKMRSLPIMFLASTEDVFATEGATELFNRVPGPKVLKIYPGLIHGTPLLSEVKNLDKEVIAWMQHPVEAVA
jgi:alpha-beta hydrolase superfamily lysophospholipase